MPIPKPNTGESRNDFMNRCISAISGEYDQDQAVAICSSQYGEKIKNLKENKQKLIDTQQIIKK